MLLDFIPLKNVLMIEVTYFPKTNILRFSVSIVRCEQIRLYRKYHKLIKKCEKLSPENLSLLIKLADALEEKQTIIQTKNTTFSIKICYIKRKVKNYAKITKSI